MQKVASLRRHFSFCFYSVFIFPVFRKSVCLYHHTIFKQT